MRPNRNTFFRTVLAVTTFSFAVAACSSGSSGDSATTSTSKGGSGVSKLEGRTWVLADATKLAAGATDVVVTAQFAGGSMTGNSGCNSYNASYTVDGSALTVSADIVTTKMACPPATTAVEQAYLEALPRVAEYAIKGSTLTLTSSSGATLLSYTASSGVAALAGAWEVTAYYTGTAVQSPEVGSTLTAEFAGEKISGSAGCNSFNGAVTVTGSSITIGPLASTLMACPSEALSTQEQQYLAALEAATTYAVAGTRLDLLRADGGFAVTFVKASPGS